MFSSGPSYTSRYIGLEYVQKFNFKIFAVPYFHQVFAECYRQVIAFSGCMNSCHGKFDILISWCKHGNLLAGQILLKNLNKKCKWSSDQLTVHYFSDYPMNFESNIIIRWRYMINAFAVDLFYKFMLQYQVHFMVPRHS